MKMTSYRGAANQALQLFRREYGRLGGWTAPVWDVEKAAWWPRRHVWMLFLLPAIFLFLSLTNVLNVDAVYLFSGVSYGGHGGILPGQPTIEPNYGFTNQALGTLAARKVLSGHLPLWNHLEGLGTPLLGEMQSAALFPLTWLQALPGGLLIEQALLQILAGVGTYLFLRRLGLSSRAALAGGVLFEFNGIFAWMRSAIFAPTAFLPWLFLVVEVLYAANREGGPWGRRLNWIALGGLVAALAVYAGFPEEVYLYGLLVAVWAGYRLFVLRGKASWPFLVDLAMVGIVGGLLALPVVLAFADFLPDAMVGSHGAQGFTGVFLQPAAVPQYLLPYIYGNIDLVTSLDVPWGRTGGYVGLAPLIAAAAALALPERRPAKILLAAWIVIALGATQGAPGIYPLFLALPLVKLTASFRYLNASWIFSFAVLAAMAVDELGRADRRLVRRALLTGLGVALAALAAACLPAEDVMAHALSQSAAVRPFMAVCALVVLGLTGLIVWTACFSHGRRATAVLTVLLALEALMNFSIPYLSYPTGRKIDRGLIAFLQQNTGFQRIVGTDSGHIDPNYGSYFGVATLNWNDLPVPRLATDYVKQQLEPYAPQGDGVLYIPETFLLSDQAKAEWSALFPRQLPNYARAGVKYVLARSSPGDVPAYAQTAEDHRADLLNAGQQVELGLPVGSDTTISGLSVVVGTYVGQANGHLRVDLCRAQDCVSGAAALETAADNQPLAVEFERSLSFHPGEMMKIIIRKTDGTQGVALWLAPLADEKQRVEVQGQGLDSSSREVPIIAFSEAAAVGSRPVYQGQTANVYELKGVRPYFDAPGCRLAPATRDEIKADCPKAGKLVRLELALPGWRAFVNGSEAGIRRVDQAFQEIDLPAGASSVRFVYAPPGVRPSLWISGGTLLLVLAALGRWAAESAGAKAMLFRRSEARAGDSPPVELTRVTEARADDRPPAELTSVDMNERQYGATANNPSSSDPWSSGRIAVVIPSYRVTAHILAVLERIGPEVEKIYVVDDACPDGSGRYVLEHTRDPRVTVLMNPKNLGVGGATMAGMRRAADDGLDVIVKIDGDGQMDPALIPAFIGVILSGEADYVKGNRFFELEGVAAMPLGRLVGNAGLSFLSKLSTGYWRSFDPTNGFLAIHASLIDLLPLEKIAKRYFFESDLLFRLNVLSALVVDVPMHSHYADERSGLNPLKEIPRFARAHMINLVKRIFYNYFIRNFSVASMELFLGGVLTISGVVYGLTHWGIRSPASAGTVMIAALQIILGVQLLLAFLNYDVGSVPTVALHPRLRTSRRPMRSLKHSAHVGSESRTNMPIGPIEAALPNQVMKP